MRQKQDFVTPSRQTFDAHVELFDHTATPFCRNLTQKP